ncbi:unnamed protein product [Trifolium pratense]|uniref:Uncharacterized protein n=1 Tax=Trifolium pratense TaxID=57577 RepID=A0ACB0JC17_TRIPR|nr:unnamed protein product [Trifolium pratense]
MERMPTNQFASVASFHQNLMLNTTNIWNGDDEVAQYFRYDCFTFRYGGYRKKYFNLHFYNVGFVEKVEKSLYDDDFSKIGSWCLINKKEDGTNVFVAQHDDMLEVYFRFQLSS